MTSEDAIKIAEIEHRAESNTRRIDKLEKQTEAIQSLATSVEVMVNEQKHQTETMMEIKGDVSKLDQKVETLEGKPAKRWDSIVDKALGALVGGLVAYILLRLGLA